ncbi:ankyrin repeat domain-containing protein 26-like [Anguilla rostrata]|uniref:ankyrin repeat domain-containing protein 26-like n=1 Tax=Anguilla rostrata TaxID=7938 RepID=UPI0030D09E87
MSKTRTVKPKEKTNTNQELWDKSLQLQETEDSRLDGATDIPMLLREAQELATKNAELQKLLDREKRERNDHRRKLLQELSDAQRKLSGCEALLEASTHHSSDFQEEKTDTQKDVDWSKEQLKERENKAESKRNLRHSLEYKDDEVIASSKRSKEVLVKTTEQLELENASLKKQVKDADSALQDEQERVCKGRELQEALQEKVEQLERRLQRSEDEKDEANRCLCTLRHSLEEKDCEVVASSQKLHEALSTSAHLEKTIKELEESVQKLDFENTRLTEQAKKTDEALWDEQERVSKAREPQEVLREKVEQLERRLQRSEDEKDEANRCLCTLRHSLEEKDCEVVASSQKLHEALSTSAHLEKTIKELEESVQKLDFENARLTEQAKKTDEALWDEQERVSKVREPQEVLREKGEQEPNEHLSLQRKLEEAWEKLELKEQSVADVTEHTNNMLAKLEAESQEKVQTAEEQNRELAARNTELQEHLEWEKSERENTLSYLQKELADTQSNLAKCEESLVNACQCSDLQGEITMQEHVNWLSGQMKKKEEQNAQSKRCIRNLRCSLEEKDCEVVASSQKLQEALLTSAHLENTIQELEESVQKLDFENTVLKEQMKDTEAALCKKCQVLVRELHDSHQQWKVKIKLRLGTLKTEQLRNQTNAGKEDGMIHKLKESVNRLDFEMARNTELQKEVRRLMSLAELKEAELFLRTQTASLQSLEWIRAASDAGLSFRLETHVRGLESKLGKVKSRFSLKNTDTSL